MYNAFGWKPPIFAHVGLLTNIHGSKLSKRSKVDGIDMNVESLRDEQGVLPEALTNFVALLGWSHRSRSDIMNLQELVQNVSNPGQLPSLSNTILPVHAKIHQRQRNSQFRETMVPPTLPRRKTSPIRRPNSRHNDPIHQKRTRSQRRRRPLPRFGNNPQWPGKERIYQGNSKSRLTELHNGQSLPRTKQIFLHSSD